MSALPPKADVRELPSGCLHIARSGHPGVPHLTAKVQAEIASVTVDESHIPKYTSFFWLHLILSWVYIAAAIKTRQGESATKAKGVTDAEC